jgi:hypothetical protein
MPKDVLLYIIASGFVSGAVVSTVIGFFFSRCLDIARSRRIFLEQSVSDLLAPMFAHLDRTRRTSSRWTPNNNYVEAQIIREANIAMRDLLLKQAHLVPPDLRDDAGKFIEHYDRWLEQYAKLRGTIPSNEPFVFVGPEGFGFPSVSERRFCETYIQYWKRLYGK